MSELAICDARGFNYHGSWGTSGLDLWQHHDNGAMAVEVARGKRYFPGWNIARWWLSHEAFLRDSNRFLANFDAGLNIFSRHSIKVMPVLFNRWRSPVCDYGGVPFDHIFPAFGPPDFRILEMPGPLGEITGPVGTYLTRPMRDFLKVVVRTHATDERIFAWDICNEPFSAWMVTEDSIFRQAELSWLTWCRDVCKASGATQPLTIGSLPILASLEILEPISDFLSFQAYYIPNYPADLAGDLSVTTKPGFEALLDDAASFASGKGKGLLAIETAWGAIDDAERVETMRYTLGELVKRRIGFTVYALHHSLVADLHAPGYGPVDFPGRLEFIEADGSLRSGHDAFNQFAVPCKSAD